MPKNVQLGNFSDFTGGLNLRANGFQLADNESPELLNVDVDPRGGFRMRRGVAPFAGTVPADVHSMLTFETTTGAREVIAGVGYEMYRSSGGSWTKLGGNWSVDAPVRGVTFKDRIYLMPNGGDQAAFRWDGTTPASLGIGWNNNLEAPTAFAAIGSMPIASTMAVHQGSVWVANTLEGGVRYPNRVRWSHPNFPEDYRDFDFIDIDTGSDGDVITALVPYGDRLLVFKRKSIHAIYGQGPDGYQVFPVSREVGCVSQEAVVNTDAGLFFFSWPEGVFHYDGKQPRWVFERLYPAVQDGYIPDGRQDEIRLGWGNRRLWVNVPVDEAAEQLTKESGYGGGYAWLYAKRPPLMDVTPTRTFVLDPTLGKNGAWVLYSLPVGPFLEWKPAGADALFLAAAQERKRVVLLDQDSSVDDFGDVDTLGRPYGAQHITAYYRTRFYDLRQPAIKKRWKAPEVVLHRQQADTRLRVEVMQDYDPGAVRRSFRLSTSSTAGAGTWGTSKWGAAKWAGNGGNRNEVARGSSLGSARSVSLKFYGPDENVPWGVDSIVLKYIPKPPR